MFSKSKGDAGSSGVKPVSVILGSSGRGGNIFCSSVVGAGSEEVFVSGVVDAGVSAVCVVDVGFLFLK